MSSSSRTKKLTEQEIDDLVVAQADDPSAWEEPVHVHKAESASVKIPAALAARAAFLARLHGRSSAEDWLAHIIQERVELEEAAFTSAKRELAEGKS